jgi:diacylglycerol kinase
MSHNTFSSQANDAAAAAVLLQLLLAALHAAVTSCSW